MGGWWWVGEWSRLAGWGCWDRVAWLQGLQSQYLHWGHESSLGLPHINILTPTPGSHTHSPDTCLFPSLTHFFPLQRLWRVRGGPGGHHRCDERLPSRPASPAVHRARGAGRHVLARGCAHPCTACNGWMCCSKCIGCSCCNGSGWLHCSQWLHWLELLEMRLHSRRARYPADSHTRSAPSPFPPPTSLLPLPGPCLSHLLQRRGARQGRCSTGTSRSITTQRRSRRRQRR